MTHRESFVRWFGEDNAHRIEEAAEYHLDPMSMMSMLSEEVRSTLPPIPNLHAEDNRGSEPFAYLFITCIGYGCFQEDRRDFHGFTMSEEAARDWCIDQDLIRTYDGDCPDYLALLAGEYNAWMLDPESPDAARWRPDKEGME